MKILTICNYPDSFHYNKMCIIWAKQIRRYCPSVPVEVLVEAALPEEVAKQFKKLDIRVLKKERRENSIAFPSSYHDKAQHNIFFKLYNLSLQDEPYIFIDADAFLLNNIDNLLIASQDKPFIAVNHEKIPKHCAHLPFEFLNTGVLVVSDPTFLDFDKKMQILLRDRGFAFPGTDQSLVNSYVREINYDYTHDLVDFSWNHCAGYTEFCDLETQHAISHGLGSEYKININHYWHEFKPWKISCPLFQNEVSR